MVNTERAGPSGSGSSADWTDLLKDSTKGLIWLSTTTPPAPLSWWSTPPVIRSTATTGASSIWSTWTRTSRSTSPARPQQECGHRRECVIGIGFCVMRVTQIVDNGYTSVSLIIPSRGTSFGGHYPLSSRRCPLQRRQARGSGTLCPRVRWWLQTGSLSVPGHRQRRAALSGRVRSGSQQRHGL